MVLKRPAKQRAVRLKKASTRPSVKPAPVQYEPDGDAEAEYATPLAEWTQPSPASQPSWALHAVRVLQGCGHLPARTGQDTNLELALWSD